MDQDSRTIALTKGRVAVVVVDAADYEWLSQWKWCVSISKKRGNRACAVRGTYRNGKQTTELMHRVILGVTDPKVEVDHIDCDALNNSRANLRIVTRSANNANHRLYSLKIHSKYKGVSVQSKLGANNKNWKAVRGHRHHIGSFWNEMAAAAAYNASAYAAYGSNARLNVLGKPGELYSVTEVK